MVYGRQKCRLTDRRTPQGQNRQRQQQADRDGHQRRLPIVRVIDWSCPGEFRPQRCVKNAPVRTDVAFKKLLGLIDRLDNVLVDISRVSPDSEIPQDYGLADGISYRLLKIMSFARPAKLANYDLLVRESLK